MNTDIDQRVTIESGLVLRVDGRPVATLPAGEAFRLAQELTSFGFEQICRNVADREGWLPRTRPEDQ